MHDGHRFRSIAGIQQANNTACCHGQRGGREKPSSEARAPWRARAQPRAVLFEAKSSSFRRRPRGSHDSQACPQPRLLGSSALVSLGVAGLLGGRLYRTNRRPLLVCRLPHPARTRVGLRLRRSKGRHHTDRTDSIHPHNPQTRLGTLSGSEADEGGRKRGAFNPQSECLFGWDDGDLPAAAIDD